MGGRRQAKNGLGSGRECDRVHAAECERHRTNHDVDSEIDAGEVPFVCKVSHVSSPNPHEIPAGEQRLGLAP